MARRVHKGMRVRLCPRACLAGLENVGLQDLGTAKRVVIDRKTTTIIGGAGSKASIDGRCNELRKQIEDATSAV